MITLLLKIIVLSRWLMSYSSELTKERILSCAKQEFLEKGFLDASLREIASKSKATTGAIYNHFKGKDGLFEAIVGEFADNLLSMFEKAHEDAIGTYDFESTETADDMGKGSFEVLDFLYSNFELSKLLFSCAHGTKYEKFVDKMIEIEENSSIKIVNTDSFPLNKINRFFMHVIATSGINNMLEAIRHDLTREEAFEYISKIQKFYYAGSIGILGQ